MSNVEYSFVTDSSVPVRWGVLGAARIAASKMIPAIIKSEHCELRAIGSRDLGKASALAKEFSIPVAYGSHEEVIADPLVDAVYIALPNHLHVRWALAAASCGKHVLCEKPLAMNAEEAMLLKAVKETVLISEAFMVRQQPRWIRLREILTSERYGKPKVIHSMLSFFMNNPDDFRNVPAFGGGALYDLGCYTVMASRFVFGQEPTRVFATSEKDAKHGVDTISSAILDFGGGRHAIFTVSTDMASSQTLQVVCEKGFIDLPKAYVPFRDKSATIEIDTSVSHDLSELSTIVFGQLDQYECEVTNFSMAVKGICSPSYGLDDAISNAKVMDAVFASMVSQRWVAV